MIKLYTKVLFVLVLSAAMFSCRRNSNPSPTPTIVGTWATLKMVNDSYENGVKVNTTTTTTFTSADYMEFKSDGTAIFSSASQQQHATYTINSSRTQLSVIYQGSAAPQLIDVRLLNNTDLVIYQEMPAVVMQSKSYKTALEGTYRKR